MSSIPLGSTRFGCMIPPSEIARFLTKTLQNPAKIARDNNSINEKYQMVVMFLTGD
jgi:hypothetical protein